MASNTAELLQRLRQHLHQHAPDARSEHLLLELAKSNRLLDEQYADALRQLASKGWRREPATRNLDHELRTILRACQENGSRFREALHIAQAGHDANNTALVKEAVDRMLRLEREVITLTTKLRAAQEKLQGVASGV